ncbi:type II secretion system protein XpsI [[Pseudomonas] boreopolis]|uniref:type II secretion system protein XpsI n=1 Tax=Xanthomonas boreopolis TaxID=86183 RepID=UPI003D9B657F
MKRQRGYSLIEVIVAFALLAGALTLLLGTLSGAARQVRDGEVHSRAALYAQSLLAAQGVEAPLQPGRLAGDLEGGRFHWTLDVQPFVDPRAREGMLQPSGPSLLQLDLQLRWGDAPSQQLHWRTLRLASPVSP